jgi:hypothetical protein
MAWFDDIAARTPLALLAAGMLAVAGCDAPGASPAGEGDAPAAEAELPPEVRAGVERMFAAFDRNRDGEITRAELEAESDLNFTDNRTGQQYTGADAVDFFFDQFDLDGDGRVTRDEMTEAMGAALAGQQGTAPQP